jgi:hypothetical protein
MIYNYKLLQTFCNENKIELTKIYTEQDRINRDTKIEGKCKNCEEKFSKGYICEIWVFNNKGEIIEEYN